MNTSHHMSNPITTLSNLTHGLRWELGGTMDSTGSLRRDSPGVSFDVGVWWCALGARPDSYVCVVVCVGGCYGWPLFVSRSVVWSAEVSTSPITPMYTPPGYFHSVHSFTRSGRPLVPMTVLTPSTLLSVWSVS
ncbi:hypothetical protein E2C01_006282 [Portunus trituberculatus]|uniref:Uncharacterized protein n=1 Tax=Portunus trituberculatus TaxID=210409 RepID=A0A5B7CXQ9_PORTR|nr:hypothetical protein [Portunus trituberculatus]